MALARFLRKAGNGEPAAGKGDGGGEPLPVSRLGSAW
jgi:hypothetical protein